MTKEDQFDRVLAELDGATRELQASLDAIDRTVADAVDSGIESGRLLGLIQAYDFLVKGGFVQSAKALRRHIDDGILGPEVVRS